MRDLTDWKLAGWIIGGGLGVLVLLQIQAQARMQAAAWETYEAAATIEAAAWATYEATLANPETTRATIKSARTTWLRPRPLKRRTEGSANSVERRAAWLWSRQMTFRVYGETGARCLESGWYVCRLHPEVEEYFAQDERFSVCPGPDDEADEMHGATWMLVEGAE